MTEIKKSPVRDLLSYLEYILARLLASLVNSLPIEVSYFFTRNIGYLLFLLMAERRKITLSNLDLAFGDSISKERKNELAILSFQNVITAIFEFFRIPKILKDSQSMFALQGTENLDRAFEKGKGVILVISHLGSWEYLAFLPYLRKYPCSVVVKSFKNRFIYEWTRQMRCATTLNPIDKKGSAKNIISEIRKNHLVAILIDQWAGIHGIWNEFFGKETSTTSIPARIALKTGAALIPAYCIRKGPGKYLIQIEPAVTIGESANPERAVTDRLNRILEEQIRRYPEQWTWSHRRWKGLEKYLPKKSDPESDDAEENSSI